MKNKLFATLCFVVAALAGFEKKQIFSNIQDPVILIQQTDFLLILSLLLASLYLFLVKDGPVDNAPVKEVTTDKNTAKTSSSDNTVLYLLSTLQEKGRLLDFVMDDISPYSDEQVGQVARVVHGGVKDALSTIVDIENLHAGEEGETISIEKDFASDSYRLSGKVSEKPPFSGRVLHKGWRAKNITLPVSSTLTNVVHPVEVEVI